MNSRSRVLPGIVELDPANALTERQSTLLMHSVDVVKTMIAGNMLSAVGVADKIKDVYTALAAAIGAGPALPAAEPLTPAVPVKKSITPNALICLEDGKSFQSLKRHLMTAYGLTPDQYRAKWGLPAEYPMVAPNYAVRRSELAKSMGLGKTKAAPPPPLKRRPQAAGHA